MKLLIAVDMEGITGVVNWDHVSPAHPEYQRFRRLMTADVNAAVAGAGEAGVDEIVVSDGHSSGTNILIEELDARARLNCGSPSPFSMVQGIDKGVDAAFFIGYHAHIGSQTAILDHTWSNVAVANLWLNERITGEIGLNAAVCGAFDVPVLMLSGDQTATAEARELIGDLETAVVKQASGRWAAECLPPAVTGTLIREAAARAVRRFRAGNAPAPLKVELPATVTVEFIYSHMADNAALLPGSTRLDARKVSFTAADMPTAYRAFRSLVSLAGR
jgi:D-amino peptidase